MAQMMIAGQTSSRAATIAVQSVKPQSSRMPAANPSASSGHSQTHLLHAAPSRSLALIARFPVQGPDAAGDASFVLLSSAEFTITDSELSAMAAAAMIGLRKPSAATGTPMLL